jgi:hypothetical protein
MKEVVINKCYGGFGLSLETTLWIWKNRGKVEAIPLKEYYGNTISAKSHLELWRSYLARKDKKDSCYIDVFTPDEKNVLISCDIPRDDPVLLTCIKRMGERANGSCAKLKIVEIPEGTEYTIEE